MRTTARVVFLMTGLSIATATGYMLSGAATGQPVASDKRLGLADKEELAKLPEGSRAITIKVQASAAVVVPGAQVDILGTMLDPKMPTARMVRVFMPATLVLAVEPSKEPDHLLVTLAVSPGDSERLFWGASNGPITLARRHPKDDRLQKTSGAISLFGRATDDKDKE